MYMWWLFLTDRHDNTQTVYRVHSLEAHVCRTCTCGDYFWLTDMITHRQSTEYVLWRHVFTGHVHVVTFWLTDVITDSAQSTFSGGTCLQDMYMWWLFLTDKHDNTQTEYRVRSLEACVYRTCTCGDYFWLTDVITDSAQSTFSGGTCLQDMYMWWLFLTDRHDNTQTEYRVRSLEACVYRTCTCGDYFWLTDVITDSAQSTFSGGTCLQDMYMWWLFLTDRRDNRQCTEYVLWRHVFTGHVHVVTIFDWQTWDCQVAQPRLHHLEIYSC